MDRVIPAAKGRALATKPYSAPTSANENTKVKRPVSELE